MTNSFESRAKTFTLEEVLEFFSEINSDNSIKSKTCSLIGDNSRYIGRCVMQVSNNNSGSETLSNKTFTLINENYPTNMDTETVLLPNLIKRFESIGVSYAIALENH